MIRTGRSSGGATGHMGRGSAALEKYEGVSEKWLDVALTVVERYGGVDAYLRDVIGLTDADFAQLQSMYLEPVPASAALTFAPAA